MEKGREDGRDRKKRRGMRGRETNGKMEENLKVRRKGEEERKEEGRWRDGWTEEGGNIEEGGEIEERGRGRCTENVEREKRIYMKARETDGVGGGKEE